MVRITAGRIKRRSYSGSAQGQEATAGSAREYVGAEEMHLDDCPSWSPQDSSKHSSRHSS